MAKTEDQVLADVRIILTDQTTATFGTATLDSLLELSVRELSTYQPLQSKGSATANGTRFLDCSSIVPYALYFDKAEYPIDQTDPEYRNIKVFGNSVEIVMDSTPTSGSVVYIYYWQPHTLSGSTSTLSVEQERLLAYLTAAHAAMNLAQSKVNTANFGGARTFTNFVQWGQLTYDRTIKDLNATRIVKSKESWPRD